jgi:thiol:disulfide interchange protein DsbA
MFKRIVSLAALTLFTLAVFPAQAQPYEEGEHYQRLPVPVKTGDPDQVEVVEIFSYGCVHCKTFEAHLTPWKENQPDHVDFTRVPATFGEAYTTLAQLYYTAEALGVTDQVHRPLFQAIHDRGVNVLDLDLAAELFEEQAGVAPEQFRQVFNSFSVRGRVQQAQARMDVYRVRGTPEIIVDGLYRVDARMAGGHGAMLDVVDYLVEQRREAAGAASNTSESAGADSAGQ